MNFNLGLTGVRVVPFNGSVSKAKETEETEDNKFKPTPTPLPPEYNQEQWDGLKIPENENKFDEEIEDLDSEKKQKEDKGARNPLYNPIHGLSTNKDWNF